MTRSDTARWLDATPSGPVPAVLHNLSGVMIWADNTDDPDEITDLDNVRFSGGSLPTTDAPRELTIKGKRKTIKGVLSADEPTCVPGQEITVFRKKKGGAKKVGSDQTDGDGAYKVRLAKAKPGKYFAEAASSIAGTDVFPARCLETRSKTLKLG